MGFFGIKTKKEKRIERISKELDGVSKELEEAKKELQENEKETWKSREYLSYLREETRHMLSKRIPLLSRKPIVALGFNQEGQPKIKDSLTEKEKYMVSQLGLVEQELNKLLREKLHIHHRIKKVE